MFAGAVYPMLMAASPAETEAMNGWVARAGMTEIVLVTVAAAAYDESPDCAAVTVQDPMDPTVRVPSAATEHDDAPAVTVCAGGRPLVAEPARVAGAVP